MPVIAIHSLEIFITILAWVVAGRPSPPYCGLTVAPNRPNCRICSTISAGHLSLWSYCLTTGRTSFSSQRSMVASSSSSSAGSNLWSGVSSFMADLPAVSHFVRPTCPDRYAGGVGLSRRLALARLVAAKRHRVTEAMCRMQIERDLGDLAAVEPIGTADFD